MFSNINLDITKIVLTHWKSCGYFKKHNGPTPADDIAPQIITDCGNVPLDFKQLGLWASPLFLQTLGPWFPNEIQNLLSSEKRTLDHWATVHFFSLAQVRRLWQQLLPNDALTPNSVHSLWSSPKFLNRCRCLLDNCQISSLPPKLCILVNQTERPFWRLRKPLQVFWVD